MDEVEQLRARVAELEAEVKRLEKRISDEGWAREYRETMDTGRDRFWS